jgi:RNA polymerase sigma factor (sigma-70 family)
MEQRPTDLSLVPPPSADRAESDGAPRPTPGPAARTDEVQSVHPPDRSNGEGTAPVVRHGRPQTPPPESREWQAEPTDAAATPRFVDDRAPTQSGETTSIHVEAEPERLPVRVPDDALLQRYVSEGDQAAFRTLVRRHERVVLGTCRRVLGDPHLAQEAFQTTLMVLARKAAVLDARQPLTAWLCKVAFRAALRLRAAVARRRLREQQAARPSADVAPLSADLESQEMFQALAEELQRLPEKYRAPLALCYLDGRTHDEAAQLIGLPRGSMAKRIREGLHRLRQRMANRGFRA